MTRKKVLIIDDSETNLLLTESLLVESGDFEAITVKNALNSMKAAQKHMPDLILLDLMMPKINGIEVLKNLKNNEKTKDIPVVIVSAKSDEATKAKTMSLGAIEFVEKPIGINNLLDKVKKQLLV
jgi:PleD family two-component response regulator